MSFNPILKLHRGKNWP